MKKQKKKKLLSLISRFCEGIISLIGQPVKTKVYRAKPLRQPKPKYEAMAKNARLKSTMLLPRESFNRWFSRNRLRHSKTMKRR